MVQLYVADQTGHTCRPVRELKAFEKVFLKAGEEKRVVFQIKEDMFSYYNVEKKCWAQVKGDYEIQIGASSEDIRLVCPVTLAEGEAADAVNVAENLPKWYAEPQGKPSVTDFEKLYGKEIRPYQPPKAGEFTLMSTLNDMKDSAAAQQMLADIRQSVGAPAEGEVSQEVQFLIEITSTTPLRRLSQQSGGTTPLEMLEGIVAAANAGY